MQIKVPPVPKESQVSGSQLDAVLIATGVSGVDLAARLDVTPETVSRWRLGKLTLSRSRWVAVLAVLGLPLDWRPAARGQAAAAKRGRGRPR
ncbi:MAG: helix-turn-helix transcriptional regulator [Deltaproteobacteria bacterium]|nr:helix-turn-helix transcriptional regulator [Deltaproteobacteria bacterium]